MILDGFLAFSINQAITATAVSTNIIDLGITSGIPSSALGGGARDIGIGDDPAMKLLVQVTTAFNNLTSLNVTLQGAVDNGAGAPAAFVNWWQPSAAVVLANLTVGARLMDMDMPRPPAGVAEPRFLQLNYTVTGTAPTAGTVSAFIVLDRMDQFYNGTQNNIMGGYAPGIIINN
jgi:hypothetical protein